MEVQQSLQEIASLLFLLHDYYFNNMESSESILMALWRFLQDIKLDHKLSILDVEHLRKIAMSSSQQSKDRPYMGYEEFYHWLSGLGMYLLAPFQGAYQATDQIEKARKQALHRILTVYVIPCMSQWERLTNSAPSSSPTQAGIVLQRRKSASNQFERLLVTKGALELMTYYREFILLWFRDLACQVCCMCCVTFYWVSL